MAMRDVKDMGQQMGCRSLEWNWPKEAMNRPIWASIVDGAKLLHFSWYHSQSSFNTVSAPSIWVGSGTRAPKGSGWQPMGWVGHRNVHWIGGLRWLDDDKEVRGSAGVGWEKGKALGQWTWRGLVWCMLRDWAIVRFLLAPCGSPYEINLPHNNFDLGSAPGLGAHPPSLAWIPQTWIPPRKKKSAKIGLNN